MDQSKEKLKENKAPGAITEIEAGIISPDQISNPISSMRPSKDANPWPKDVDLPLVKLVSDENSRTDNALAITETSVPKTP